MHKNWVLLIALVAVCAHGRSVARPHLQRHHASQLEVQTESKHRAHETRPAVKPVAKHELTDLEQAQQIIANAESVLKHAHLAGDVREQTKRNVEHMQTDLEMMQTTTNTEAIADLMQAIRMRNEQVAQVQVGAAHVAPSRTVIAATRDENDLEQDDEDHEAGVDSAASVRLEEDANTKSAQELEEGAHDDDEQEAKPVHAAERTTSKPAAKIAKHLHAAFLNPSNSKVEVGDVDVDENDVAQLQAMTDVGEANSQVNSFVRTLDQHQLEEFSDEESETPVHLPGDPFPGFPVDQAEQPADQEEQPADQEQQPVDQEQPADQEEQPADQEEQPADQEEQPADQEEQPADQEQQPADQEEQPADQEEQPADQEQPVDQEEQPADQEEQPADQEQQPVDQEEQPVDQEQPADKEEQPADQEEQSADQEEQPADQEEPPADQEEQPVADLEQQVPTSIARLQAHIRGSGLAPGIEQSLLSHSTHIARDLERLGQALSKEERRDLERAVSGRMDWIEHYIGAH